MLDSLSWVRTPTRSLEMTLSTCPTMIARARAERVWSQLQDPRTYDRWMDAHLVSVTPSGPAEPGQCILLRAPTWGRFFAVRITVHSVDAANRVLTLTGRFPFGLQLHSRIAVKVVDDRSSRVEFG